MCANAAADSSAGAITTTASWAMERPRIALHACGRERAGERRGGRATREYPHLRADNERRGEVLGQQRSRPVGGWHDHTSVTRRWT